MYAWKLTDHTNTLKVKYYPFNNRSEFIYSTIFVVFVINLLCTKFFEYFARLDVAIFI